MENDPQLDEPLQTGIRYVLHENPSISYLKLKRVSSPPLGRSVKPYFLVAQGFCGFLARHQEAIQRNNTNKVVFGE